jgi:agmatinase
LIPTEDPEQAVWEMKNAASKVLSKGKFLMCIGGDHAISIGPAWAALECLPEVGILQIDAHLDMRDRWNGSRFNHACVMRRIFEKTTQPIVQVGIRSVCQAELEFIQIHNMTPYYAHRIDPWDDSWVKDVVQQLPSYIYLTIDLDGLDPSVIPGTGTPEPGGLTYRQLVKLIQAVGKKSKIVAADITELIKLPGSVVSEYTAAKIASQIFIHGLASF